MAIINDGAADPMGNPSSPENRSENVLLMPIAIGRWPFLFVVTTRRIEAGVCCNPAQTSSYYNMLHHLMMCEGAINFANMACLAP